METGDYLTQLRSDGEALAAAGRLAPAAPIEGCPGWDMADLLGHTGGIHQWVTEMLTRRSTTRISRRDLAPPPTGPAVLDWYLTQFGRLVQSLEQVDPDETVWTFGAVQPGQAGWWHRRMAQETALHRWDGQHAAGIDQPLDAALAADGIDEYLEIYLEPALARDPIEDLTGSLHLHGTDESRGGADEWWLGLSPTSVERRHEHAKADAAVRAPVSDLLLWLWNRIPTESDGLQVFGDAGILERWKRLHF